MGLVKVFIILALLAVVFALIIGLWSMSRGGSLDRSLSVSLMYIRTGLHALAVALLVLALFLGQN